MDYMEDALYEAIASGDTKSFTEYLDKGLDVNHAFRSTERTDRLGKTLIEVVLELKQKQMAAVLVQRKCNANLKYIVDIKNYTYILKPYKKKNCLKLTCMFPAIVQGDVSTIKTLVEGGYDITNHDERGCTPLWHAVDLDNYEMVKALLTSKFNAVNIPDNAKLYPLHIAAMHGNTKIASLLIRSGAQVDVVQIRGWTSLLLACRASSVSTARLLLLNGADPNHVGKNSHTPLSTTLQYTECLELADMLLESGAEVNLALIKRCKEEKFPNLIANPGLFHLLRFCSECPRTMRSLCCLVIRKALLNSASTQHLVKKVETLPLPYLIKEYILLGHLI